MKKIKILITIKELSKSGVSRSILSIINNINKNKFQVDLVMGKNYDKSYKKQLEECGIKIHILENRDKHPLKYIKNLKRIVQKNKYDIVHINGNSSMIILELLGSYLGGCKTRIVHSHNTTCNHKILNKIFTPIAHLLTTYNVSCGKDAGIWMFGKQKFDIIKNGINLETFTFDLEKRKEIRNSLNVNDEEVLIGHVGTFTDQKNHDYIIRIFEEFNKQIDSKLLLIGDGINKKIIKKIIQEKKLNKKVMFAGEVDNVCDLMQAMDIFILPSKYEGLPITLVEAQANGLPCVVSSKVTREATFSNKIVYEDIEEKNINDWCCHIKRLLKINRQRNSKQNKNNLIEKGYDDKTSTKLLEKIYIKLFKNNITKEKKNFLRIFDNELLFMLILFPFFRPHGLSFTLIRKIWLVISVLIITFLALKNRKYLIRNKFLQNAFLYFGTLILITLIIIFNAKEGFEKMLAAPFLCIFYTLWMKKNPLLTLKGTVDLLLIEQIMCLLTWDILFLGSDEYTLMGIRPIYGSVGILCCLVSFLYWLYCNENEKWKCIILISLIFIQVIGRWISSGVICLFVFFFVYFIFPLLSKNKIIYKLKSKIKINRLVKDTILSKEIFGMLACLFFNFLIVFFRIQERFSFVITRILGESISMNNRTVVWDLALNKIRSAPIFGYGAFGVYMKMPYYWVPGTVVEWNYAHNQILQVLFDGGIVLLIVFVFFHLFLANQIRKISNKKINIICFSALISYLVIMIPEAPADYLFYFAFVSIIGNISILDKININR